MGTPPSRTGRRLGAGRVLLALALVASAAWGKGKDEPPAAKIEVHGLGWWKDREQRVSLERLLGKERGETLDANAVEDAAFLLLSALVEGGFEKPKIETVMTAADGTVRQVVFDEKLEASLPRPFQAKRVDFRVTPGVRYRFEDVQFIGLQALRMQAAREFFVGEKVLIRRGSPNAYSKARLRHALDGVEEELRRLGYADATVTAKDVQLDDKTGRVSVDVDVHEGARWEVKELHVKIPGEEEQRIPELLTFVGRPWSQFWQQDVSAAVRNYYYHQGHPDVRVRLRPEAGDEHSGVKPVIVVARVNPGPEVRIGQVRFEGEKKTKQSVLRRRVSALEGARLDPLALEQARFRLGRLGVFDSVDLRYEPDTGPLRDPVFVLREGRELETSLLFGYGSYEQLRGGVEVRQYNLFGLAHQSRLLLLESMKSSRGEYSYTVPELFGESIDGTARAFGLRRQETSFLRQEYGANAAISSRVPWLGANATLGYTFQSLGNRNNTLTTQAADEKQVNAASVDLDLVRDRRDNPLRPRHGYRWFFHGETASHYFGGTVDYQRIELGGSYHASWGSGRWVHLGLTHGAITTWGTDDSTLPVNKRFFPGGDNSIRGYREGEAAPLGADGKFVGAKSYVLANLELEQALTPKWSLVVFGDALGTAVRLADYPFNEELYSVGLGVRFQTLIGPVRAEYGRNVNPRPGDPGGTLLFSIGFPF